MVDVGVKGRAGARRAVIGLALIALAALGVSGCTKPDPVEASTWNMPDVVWDGGVAPSGGAEASPWAKEFRAANLSQAYAWARKDASYAEYVQQFGYDVANKDAEFMVSSYNSFDDRDRATGDYVQDAPARWEAQRLLINSVSEDPDGRSAIIDECYVIYSVGSFHEEVICAQARLTHNADGTIGLDGVLTSDLPADFVPADEPPIEDIPIARWVTPITAPTLPDEVKMPLPRDYYVKLGVISE